MVKCGWNIPPIKMYTRVYLLIQTIWHNDKSVTDSSGISRGAFAFCLLNPQFIGAVISSHHQIEWINIEFTSVICDNNGLLGSVLSARRPLEAGRAFSNPLYPPHTIGRSGNYFVAVTYPIQWNIGEAPLKCCCILFSIHNRCLCECQNKSRFFADFIRRDFYDILSIRPPALSSIETLGCSCCKYSLVYIYRYKWCRVGLPSFPISIVSIDIDLEKLFSSRFGFEEFFKFFSCQKAITISTMLEGRRRSRGSTRRLHAAVQFNYSTNCRLL